MKRPAFSSTLVFLLAAGILAVIPAVAGEQPGPGLEIIDGATGIDNQPLPYTDTYSDQFGTVPPQVQVPTQPQGTTWADDPYATNQFESDPFVADPNAADPYATTVPQGSEPVTPPAPYDDPFAVDDRIAETPVGGSTPPPSLYPSDPYNMTLDNINVQNRNFPGIGEAVAQRSLRGVADIVWQVLRERRVVDATISRGPGASRGTASAYELQQAIDAINYQPGNAASDSPMRAAARINIILDSFEQPVIDDYNIGNAMELAMMRLFSDLYAVRVGMSDLSNDAMFLELSRTYIRAATSCDYFIFDRRQLAADINAIMKRSYPMFYPDGASVAGDVGGISGNLFQSLLMLDFYTRDDSWFRRDINSAWKSLELPARYMIDVSCPDQSLPNFGPRGTRDIWPMEIAALAKTFPPKTAFKQTRIGLAASHSYPDSSNQQTYGGIYVTRSGPESNARYMAMRVGPLGDLPGIPQHFDFGSMVLMSRNIKFIVDPGGFGGEAAGSAAHSNLSLDGQYVIPSTYNEPGVPVESVWRTNASIDYLTDMAGFGDGKTWQRTMLYVKDLPGENRSDYWVLLDHVDMKNDPQSRQARIRFQLAPGINAYHDGSGILATAGGYIDTSALRIFAIDANSELTVSEGSLGLFPSHIYDSSGGSYAAPAVTLTRTLIGDTTTATLLYPSENSNHRPARIERDADIIRGRTGAIVVDHGQDKIDVIAWAPPGTELVTPTLNLQLSADAAVFRIRKGKIVRINFVNLQRFQAKEPDGGLWSMRVNGPAQTLTLEPERGGGWQILADPANVGSASLVDVNLGPAITRRKVNIRPGEIRVIPK